jgi:hypothetical protein
MSAVAARQRCEMCCGYGCLVIWRHYRPRAWTTGPTLSGHTVPCPACRTRELERISWLRSSYRQSRYR